MVLQHHMLNCITDCLKLVGASVHAFVIIHFCISTASLCSKDFLYNLILVYSITKKWLFLLSSWLATLCLCSLNMFLLNPSSQHKGFHVNGTPQKKQLQTYPLDEVYP